MLPWHSKPSPVTLHAAGARAWHQPAALAGAVKPSSQHLMVSPAITNAVISGLLVALIIAVARLVWHRRRVPTALSQQVHRRSYLGAVLAESERPGVRRLDVLAPRLMPAKGNKDITRIQSAWERIHREGAVRVLAGETEECLEAGGELLQAGIEVKVLPKGPVGSGRLSCHLFETADPAQATAIVNNHQNGVDKPGRINGAAPIAVFRGHFDTEWAKARSLESVLAGGILPNGGGYQGRDVVLAALEQAEAELHLHARTVERILPHLAFRDSAAIIFIVGLPGTGKSHIRRLLTEQLESLRIDCQSLSDYPYAYLDFVRVALKLDPLRTSGFEAFEGGAFTVRDESVLLPALRALEGAVRDSVPSREVTLVEFARAGLAAAFQEFDDVRLRSQVIHVSAPPELRLERIRRRAMEPEACVGGETITLKLSDNHLLPRSAELALYASDDIDALKASPRWRERIFEISNSCDGSEHIETRVSEFIDAVVDPYRLRDRAKLTCQLTVS